MLHFLLMLPHQFVTAAARLATSPGYPWHPRRYQELKIIGLKNKD